MDVRTTLFGSKLRIAVTVVVALGAVASAAVAPGVLGAPSVRRVDNSFGSVNASTTVIETDLTVNNPNPFGVSYGGVTIDYTVTMNDIAMASGEKRGLSAPPGNSTVPFRTRMHNEKIPQWWVSHIRNGENTTLGVEAVVHSGILGQSVTTTPVQRPVETDVIGQFNSTETRPINASRPFVDDPIAYINRTNARWGNVTESKTPIEVTFLVYNPKDRPLVMSELGYNITMNDIDMGHGKTDQIRVPPHTAKEVHATIVLENRKLDEWWVSHLRNGQTTDLAIDFYAEFDLSVTTVRLPLKGTTYRKTITTHIFCEDDCGVEGGSDGGSGGNETQATTTQETTTTQSDTTTTTTTTQETTTTTTTQETTTTQSDTTTTTTSSGDGGGGLL